MFTVKFPRLWLLESGILVPPNMTEMGPPNVLFANIEFVVMLGPVMPVGPVSL
ncbi:hypothetical protein P4J05_09575 [Bacillus anthracis]|nr:hypothetical protein [Bacillus anthracis]